jgi:hypothetical protein
VYMMRTSTHARAARAGCENTHAQALVAILLLVIALLVVASSFSKEEMLKRRYCKIAVVIHGLMMFYRVKNQSQLSVLKNDTQGQLVGDVVFAGSWLMCLLTTPLPQ